MSAADRAVSESEVITCDILQRFLTCFSLGCLGDSGSEIGISLLLKCCKDCVDFLFTHQCDLLRLSFECAMDIAEKSWESWMGGEEC